MARASGHTELSEHIASSQQHMRGMTLEAGGAPEQAQEHVRFPWKVTKDGATLATGTNLVTFADDGRFAMVVGFTDSE